jgi:hypothetical protein
MARRSGIEHYVRATAARLRADGPVYAAIAAYCGAGLLYVASRPDFRPVNLALTALSYLHMAIWLCGVVLPLTMLALGAGRVLLRRRRRRLVGLRVLLAPRPMGRYLAGAVLAFAFLFVFFATFTSVKQALPDGTGFPHDAIQAEIDRVLHFGVDPWRWTFVVAGQDWLRALIEANYHSGWFTFIYGALFVVAAGPMRQPERLRYLFGYMLVWVVCGNIVAGLFLSAGPAYYGLVTGDEARFAEQLAFLAGTAESPSSTIVYQDYLWRAHAQGWVGLATGISAFPSLHVALAAYNALFVAERSRLWGALCWAYVGVILFSSVYLAWHYAIDGYASLALVVAIHWLTRKAFEARPARERGLAGPLGRGAALTRSRSS